MSLINHLKPGGKNGVPSGESRDPIGYLVAGLNRLAQSDLIDRVGLRRPTEQAVFNVTRSGFKTLTAASRTFAKQGKPSEPGVRVAAAQPKGVFDLTPTEDEQMLVDVVTEFAEEVVRPAAAEANEACEAPAALLEASLEIGLPILGVPEALGGISEERSAAFASKAENRKEIAKAIAPTNYLNQPETVLEQILTGTYADGLGAVKKDPGRIDFDPFPWDSFAVWILTQMKRWGQIKGDVNYGQLAEQVFLATDAAKTMRENGMTPPAATKRKHTIMGKEFDPAMPEEYIASFAIKRT